MKFSFTSKPAKTTTLIFPLFSNKKALLPSGYPAFDAYLKKEKSAGNFEGQAGEVCVKYPGIASLPSRIVCVCLGEPEKLKVGALMSHLGHALKDAKFHKGHEVSILLSQELAKFGQTLGEVFTLANYHPAERFTTGKGLKKIKEHSILTCHFVPKKISGKDLENFKKEIDKGHLIAESVNTIREWVNGPPNFTSPEFMEEQAAKIAKENGCKFTVLRKKELEKLSCGGILAVNRGSSKEARMLVLEYWPGGEKKGQPIVLAGKGIIFDSGGYNLKPTGYIENMHLDMAGAAVVIGVFMLLKKLKISVPVIGITPITENCIDANAVKPSEIVTMFNGKTVEITNTDAEGRLVLGDTLAYAVKNFKPRFLIDLATLTGACMVALGERFAGLFTNDKDLKKRIQKAARETDEDVWPLPLHPDFSEPMKGEISDYRNSDEGRYAGASKGAEFLRFFVGKTKWAHIDIAGPAYVTKPKHYDTKRATGFGLRLLIRLLEALSREVA